MRHGTSCPVLFIYIARILGFSATLFSKRRIDVLTVGITTKAESADESPSAGHK